MTQNPNWPLSCWQANFAVGANAAPPLVYDDLTDRVGSWSSRMGKQFELNAIEAGVADLMVRNADEALNPANSTSPYNSSGKALKPYRRLRHWEAWPLAGNFLNATNDQWVAAGTLADTAGFQGGTLGTWAPVAGCALASSTTRAHDGTTSMRITWATTAGGAGTAAARALSVPLRARRAYTVSCWVWIAAGPAVVLSCAGVTATSTSSTGAWQRVVLTVTPGESASTDLMIYAAGATTSGQQVWIDSVQVEAGAAVGSWVASGPTIYPVHSGYVERLPLSWRHAGFEGWAALTSVDALAMLSRVILQDCLTQDQLQDAPTFLWPLWDDSSSAVAANIGANSAAGAVMVLAPMGTPASITTTFGESGGPGVDSLQCMKLAPAAATDTYAPLIDWSGAVGYTLGGNLAGYAVELWFSAASPPSRAMHLMRLWASGLEEAGVLLTADGHLQMIHRDASGSTDSTVTSAGTYQDDAWHHVAVNAWCAASVIHEELWVDGLLVGTATRGGATTMAVLGVMLGHDYRAGTNAFEGLLARLAVYPAALSSARLQSHWLASRTGFAGDSTGQRIGRVLAWAGWQGETSLPDGLSRHGPASGMANTSATAACQLAAGTEHGAFLALPSGELALVPRDAYYRQIVSVRTFGEAESSSETPYLDAASELDPTYVYNQISVTRQGGNAQSARDDASVQDYGVRSTDVSTSHDTDVAAQSMALYLLTQYRDGHLRVAEVQIDPASNPALWPVALGTQYGDRVTWRRRTSAGLTMVIDGYVEAIDHTVDGATGKWVTTLRLQPVDTYQAGIIGDPTYGVAGSTLVTTY